MATSGAKSKGIMKSVELSVGPTRDLALVKQIMTDPSIWPGITDDGCPKPEDFVPLGDEHVIYLLAYKDSQVCGLFMLHPHNEICWEVHTCLLPEGRGWKARELVAQGFKWVWANTKCLRIITNVPAFNFPALGLAHDVGFEVIGVNKGSFMKQGVVYDQTILGISRPELSCLR